MTPQNPTTRKPGQRRTVAEKVADGKARRDAQQARAAAKAVRPASTRQCAAGPSGSYGITLAKRCTSKTIRQNAALCEKHESAWRAFRKTEEYRTQLAAKRAAREESAKDNVVKLPVAKDADATSPVRRAAFATVELEKKAAATRRASKGEQPAKA